MATQIDRARLRFEEAIAALQLRTKLKGTRTYRDLSGDEHRRAFAVAGAMKADLLADLRDAVQRAKNYRDRKRAASRRDGQPPAYDSSRRDVTASRVTSHIERDSEAGSLQASSSSHIPTLSLSSSGVVERESEGFFTRLFGRGGKHA